MNNLIKNTLQISFGFIAAIVLTGCGANGPQFTKLQTPQKENGLVYIYRPSQFIGAAAYFTVNATNNDQTTQVIGKLVNGSHLIYQANKGQLQIWGETESKSSVSLDIKPGNIYCVKGEIGIGVFVGRPNLTIVDKSLCEVELKDTKLNN